MTRVLLVDDDEDFLVLARKFLAREDPTIDLSTSRSAEKALQKLTKEDFDAIVTDYQMPGGLSGLELLERLRTDGSSTPFIIFTGRGREDVAIRALNMGAAFYLKKGGELKSLFAELAHFIKRAIEKKLPVVVQPKREVQAVPPSDPSPMLINGLKTLLESQMTALRQEFTGNLRTISNSLRKEFAEPLYAIEKQTKVISNGVAQLHRLFRQEITGSLRDSSNHLPQEVIDHLTSIESTIKEISSQSQLLGANNGQASEISSSLANELRGELAGRLSSLEEQIEELSSVTADSSPQTAPSEASPERKIPGSMIVAAVKCKQELKEALTRLISVLRWPQDKPKSSTELLKEVTLANQRSREIAGEKSIPASLKGATEQLGTVAAEIEQLLTDSDREEFLAKDIRELAESQVRLLERLAEQLD
ncbi:MAG: response regulator [Candidatus Hodarchaeales archaeon]|jgi:DNA-binding response OmpR family regulator